jgi:hypothetical protein
MIPIIALSAGSTLSLGARTVIDNSMRGKTYLETVLTSFRGTV